MAKVSVLINNYNYARFLNACIDSIFNQTYKEVEIVVYDDGSKDDSLEILRAYGDKIKVIAKPNFGKTAAFNQANAIYEAFKQSNGDIICLLDSDDVFLPNKIATVVALFEKDSEICMVQNKMFEIDEHGKRTGKVRKNILYNLDVLNAIYSLKKLELFFVPTSGLSFRRNYLQKALPIKEDEFPSIWSDIRLSRTAIFYGKVATADEPLGEYRRHVLNDSNKLKDEGFKKNFKQQHYGFFNKLASQNNMPVLSSSKSSLQKVFSGINFIFLKAPLKNKFKYLFNKVAKN